jgi:hypothetical protein
LLVERPSLLVVADQMTSSLPVQAAAASGAIAPPASAGIGVQLLAAGS